MEGVMDHIVLNVIDDDTMLDFYMRVLELKPERVEEYRSGVSPFPSLRLNADTIIDLFPKKMWAKTAGQSDPSHGRENMNHFCLVLTKDDWVKLTHRLESNGVSIEDGPVKRWGARGDGISVYFRDPENNYIEAKYYADP